MEFFTCPSCEGNARGIFEAKCMLCRGKEFITLTELREFRDRLCGEASRPDAPFRDAAGSLLARIQKALECQ